MNYILLIPIVLVLIIIIMIVVNLIKKSNETKEKPTSILDVNEVGVPSSAEFSYGYEKEATVVMNPVDAKTEEEIKPTEENKVDVSNEETTNEESEDK